MARSSDTMSIYEAKTMLQEKLTCPGCSNILVEPRVLSCMHSFCFNCVQKLEVGEANSETGTNAPFICCPVCEAPTEYPADGNATSLPPAFHLIAMLELYKIVHKVQKGDKTSCDNCNENCAAGYCKHCTQLLCRSCITIHRRWSNFEKHDILGVDQIANQALQGLPLKIPSEMKCLQHDELSLFICSTCDDLVICQSCTVHEHREHKFYLISEEYPKHEEQIRRSLEPLKEQADELKEAIAMITSRENEILELVNEMMGQTKRTAQLVTQAVEEAEETYYSRCQEICHIKLENLSRQKVDLKNVLDDFIRCENHVEEELRVASSQQILSKKNQMIDTICKIVQNKSGSYDLSPKESANICSAPTDELIEKCQDIAKVEEAEISGVQIIDGKGSGIGVVGKEFWFNIRVKTSPPGYLVVPQSIQCSFSCATDDEAIQCTVEEISPAKYTVCYLPPDSQTRHFKVDINEKMHYDIPFTVRIARIPQLKDRLKAGLTKPWGVSFNNRGQIIATDFESHQVKIFDGQGGHLLKTIGQRGKTLGHFKSPAGIAVNQQNQIVVVESGNHRVQIVSDTGKSINHVGEYGENPLQFAYPYDVAISRSGLIFVSDCYNHRIQVLNPDLSFAGMFGTEGVLPGQFKNPIGIAIDEFEHVFIVDSGNHRIQQFTLAGDFIQEFGTQELTIPSGIVVDSNNVVYVTDTGIGEVALFNSCGNFLGNYASQSDELSRPTGITIGNGNRVYVCDWGVNDILTLY